MASQIPPLLSPLEGFQSAVALGAAKAQQAPRRIFGSAVLGGAFIAYGAYLACSVGGCCPELQASNPGLQKFLFGAVGLPFGASSGTISGLGRAEKR